MKRAILSDIHGNREALDAVLLDIEARSTREKDPVDEIICLGDTVGYGPEPVYCLDKMMTWKTCLQGNHEKGVALKAKAWEFGISGATGFGGRGAFEGIHWTLRRFCGSDVPIPENTGNRAEWKAKVEAQTRELLDERTQAGDEAQLAEELTADYEFNGEVSIGGRLFTSKSVMARQFLQMLLSDASAREIFRAFEARMAAVGGYSRYVKYVSSLPTRLEVDDAVLVHDNPLQPGDSRYMLDGETMDRMGGSARRISLDIEDVFASWDEHVGKDANVLIFGHSHFPGVHSSPKVKGRYMLNPGSVGMPRDGATATYAIWNDKARGALAYRVVEVPLNDVEKTAERMVAAGLPDKLAIAREKQMKTELD